MIRRLIRSLTAFPRFVLHDLRLSARSLASMFGSLSLRRLAALIALLFLGLHIAAYPVAGWLIGIEDGPDGVMRITAILASGAVLVFPWIVGQSIADFSRTLFGRSDLELILASPVDAHALLAARALSISVGAVASVGLCWGRSRGRVLRSFWRWACFCPQARDARASSARSPRRRSARPRSSARRLSPCCPSACEPRPLRPWRRLRAPRARSTASCGRRCARRRATRKRCSSGQRLAQSSLRSHACCSASASRARRSPLRARRLMPAPQRGGRRALARAPARRCASRSGASSGATLG